MSSLLRIYDDYEAWGLSPFPLPERFFSALFGLLIRRKNSFLAQPSPPVAMRFSMRTSFVLIVELLVDLLKTRLTIFRKRTLFRMLPLIAQYDFCLFFVLQREWICDERSFLCTISAALRICCKVFDNLDND